jgi:hypothetical protein
MRLIALAISAVLIAAHAGETDRAPWPLWDGAETIEQYARRVNLPPTKTLELGNGVKLELVLIRVNPSAPNTRHYETVAGKSDLPQSTQRKTRQISH